MSYESPDHVEYFFNTRTHAVEEGRVSSWEDLMGPYATREEAEHALDKARKRSAAWDDDDADWRGDRA